MKAFKFKFELLKFQQILLLSFLAYIVKCLAEIMLQK